MDPNQPQDPQQPGGQKNHGKEIGDIVRTALQSGDLSRLGELGPAIGEAVKDNIPQVKVEVRTGAGAQKPQPAQRPQPAQNAPARPVWQGSGTAKQSLRAVAGLPAMVLGGVGLGVFGIGALGLAAAALITGVGVLEALAAGFAVAAAACGVVLGTGRRKNQLAKRLRAYDALFDQKPVYTFEELAAKVGRTPKDIKKDFRAGIKAGLAPAVRMDAGETCVMRGEEAWQLYLESENARARQQQEEAERKRRLSNPATADIEHFKREGEATIEKIRAANRAIPGQEISDKLARLEDNCRRIFQYVEQHPEKLPETRKFMSYYLPTTLKMVEKYRQYEEMDYRPENVQQTRAEIERALDTINEAFANMLESLFHHDTLDVSTDIEVLEKMLEQEGLTGRHFTPGENTPPPEN
ncbi:5-bromo-4-chloroindolyl phosphate hydrolysis family protein [Ruminococcaceae bacterium OttesenSCG-928-O06]|nr:5-bromo-4-chloroindolyl phosphate hydrolysis family protein [Ruminococcaceae bacterium OttesenSCG-928-O06]